MDSREKGRIYKNTKRKKRTEKRTDVKKMCCQVQTEGIGLHWGEKVQYML